MMPDLGFHFASFQSMSVVFPFQQPLSGILESVHYENDHLQMILCLTA